MIATLEEDLLEIEQTLLAVEQKLADRKAVPNSSLESGSSNFHHSPAHRATNHLHQAPKKSILLKREISLAARGNTNLPRQKSTPTNPQAAVVKAVNTTQASNQIVPSLRAIIEARIKLKANSQKVAVNSSASKPAADHQLSTSKRSSFNKAKLVYKFNSKNSKLEAADVGRSNLVLVKSARVKQAAKLTTNASEAVAVKISSRSPSLDRAIAKAKAAQTPAERANTADSGNRRAQAEALPRREMRINPPAPQANLANHNLKEQLIKNALSEVPMNHYHDHDQQKSLRKQYKLKAIRNLSLAGFVLLFGGYIFFLNIPSISFRVAAIQAGMSSTASIPAYKPAGYSLSSKAAYGPGYVRIEMKNKSGNKLNLTQEKSAFDSEALKDNVVARVDGGYSTYVKDGLTIYLYNNGGASWVNKGEVYNLSGNTSDLSSDEILNMAVSM